MRGTFCLVAALLVALSLQHGSARAQDAASARPASPPPVSGRSLSNPESITAADVMARLLLAHENLELIRLYMGRAPGPQPFFRVKNASPAEALFASLNLTRRGLQLAFEQLRVERQFGGEPAANATAHDVFKIVDRLLITALEIKRELRISKAVAEKAAPESTTMTDVVNQVMRTGGVMSAVVDKKTLSTDVFFILTIATRQAMALHQHHSRKLMPDPPEFVANKTPDDVIGVLEASYALLVKLAEPQGLTMLTLERSPEPRAALPDDAFELALVIVAELDRLLLKRGIERPFSSVNSLGRKVPAHAFQRASLLRTILVQTASGKLK